MHEATEAPGSACYVGRGRGTDDRADSLGSMTRRVGSGRYEGECDRR